MLQATKKLEDMSLEELLEENNKYLGKSKADIKARGLVGIAILEKLNLPKDYCK